MSCLAEETGESWEEVFGRNVGVGASVSSGRKRVSLDFNPYQITRPTNIFFTCPRCSYKAELQHWLYHKTEERWFLHLDKFHRCGQGKTQRCSQRVLPEYAKNWPTMSNDTAKRLLKQGHIAKISIAPSPDLSILPLRTKEEGRERETHSHRCIMNLHRNNSGDSFNFSNRFFTGEGILTAEGQINGAVSGNNTTSVFLLSPFLLRRQALEQERQDSFDRLLDQIDFSPFEECSQPKMYRKRKRSMCHKMTAPDHESTYHRFHNYIMKAAELPPPTIPRTSSDDNMQYDRQVKIYTFCNKAA